MAGCEAASRLPGIRTAPAASTEPLADVYSSSPALRSILMLLNQFKIKILSEICKYVKSKELKFMMEKPKTKVDGCASHTSHVICRVCGIVILNKNYERHLAKKHPSENSKNLKPKDVLDMSQWLKSASIKRKGNDDQQSDSCPKRRNLSGDSGINDSDVDSDPGEEPTVKERDISGAGRSHVEPGHGGQDTNRGGAGSAWSEAAGAESRGLFVTGTNILQVDDHIDQQLDADQDY